MGVLGERIKLRRLLKIMGCITVVLMLGALALGISTSRYMKGVIRDQFNEQQLALARATANRVETTIQNAIVDLILLNSLPAIQYCDAGSYEVLLLSTLPLLNRDHIIEIRRVDRDGKTMLVANEQGIGMRHFGVETQDAAAYLSWASDMSNRGKTMGTGIRSKDPSKERRTILLDLITPTYEETANAAHPHPTHRFAGYLRATLDVSKLLREIIPHIKSGKSGYAWVLDSSGSFLHHPEAAFVGENAFEARSNRNPRISFARINEIQQNEMLRGMEGTGTYISGWHRDVVEPMEKLIAFSPVRIRGPYLDYIWSVAVAAPAHEIEGIVNTVYARQSVLQSAIVFLILLGSIIVLLYELRWSTILEHEVESKTRDIQHYASELERSESLYRSLVESAEDLIFTVDVDGIIRTANRHMASFFGVRPGDLAGRGLLDLLPAGQAEQQLALVRKTLEDRRGVRIESALHVQEQDVWLNVQYIPVTGEAGDGELALGIARDITDRKSLEAQLINTEKLASLGTLAAGVAHEINNPLGIMLGFCELLLEKSEPGTIEHNDLKIIERHGLHCKSIVERLLSFARISEEAEEFCDLNGNVESILSVVKHTLEMNNIQLVTALTQGLPMVRGDSRGIQQVLLNLISNAIHAMDSQGTLTVVTRPGKKPGWIEAVVSDTGCGIPKDVMQKIFDPFFTTKKVGDGTGLGLSVSYGIVSNYGGSIDCESQAEGEASGQSGTAFTITLPARPDEPSDRERPAQPRAAGEGTSS
ncbi:MAG: ATP-binding protein [Syntrophobacteraceae bacterium]|jgi:PAS domain S-box-containing protein|nr:ATP-binding protein [Syntrophobacteraceae bacterium]